MEDIEDIFADCEDVESILHEARKRIGELVADPRLQVPLDGHGSHRHDLAELRVCQAKIDTLRAHLDRLQSVDTMAAAKRDGEVDRLRAEVDRLRCGLTVIYVDHEVNGHHGRAVAILAFRDGQSQTLEPWR